MKTSKLIAASVALCVSGTTPMVAFAQSEQMETLSLTAPWTRATPPRAQAAGGFLTIENSGSAADRLLEASSPVAGRVEIHEMKMTNDTMIMRPVEGGLEIPAGGSVTLAPGGLHIMFMELNGPFAEGSMVPVTLTFEKRGTMEIALPVHGIGAREPDQMHSHEATKPGADQ